jgi:hypothetical protein
LQIIRQQSFRAIPWKNGGGITHEAIRVPPTGDRFLWRVSLARVEASGPFSDFTGYERTMVLLQGRGLALEFGNGEQRRLHNCGDWVEFDGALPVRCALRDGPCVDLNLMVAKSLSATVRIDCSGGSSSACAAAGESLLIFSLEAPLSLQDDAGRTVRLERWDLAVLSRGSVRFDRMTPDAPCAPSAVFIATITQ